eukprot:CAMPEP_0118702426 /NCGR_PEP_ID=MMETSP0800-20121206/17889_1 /TAXON_ID=210618 ORGANISM="Striatella unipunctata, Strain CCMP2910" /NCGR_SAMPLE_ID=MMETSP0800 /ASSEMBLY_ACC=CAM_ASM_000638 /LENGTH=220 /DNA_ID=CAMNT_0006603635 /DNA_START=371 /DNA_END=1033 /DNA_ORIENTATION=-
MVKLALKYLNLGPVGGRGGVQRFFMLAHGIKFEETLFTPSEEWGAEKKRLIETGENPCGSVPVTYITGDGDQDSKTLSQHIATCRYLARVNKFDTGDIYKDFVQDLVADEYQSFRALWVDKTFTSDEKQKEEYRKKLLLEELKKFDALYKKYKTSDVYLSTSPAGVPLWGDSAMFGIVYDNIKTGHITEEALAAYPNIEALYKAYSAIPTVAAWIAEKSG